ncbi:MAG: AAA family ATPase, partial [Phocaeicola sp.]
SYFSDWEEKYGASKPNTPAGARFTALLRRAMEQTGRRAVVLIDEYDKPILDVMDTPMEEKNRNVLKAFYSTFKAADAYLQFILLTGVTKFSQVSIFSGFNQPRDISMSSEYETICGISQEEVDSYFAEPIAEMAQKYKCTPLEMRELLKAQYDGYHFSEEMTDVYNPFSLISALSEKRIEEYWFSTGTPTYLVKLLQHNEEQINELIGEYYDADRFANYRADVQMPLPMIYQSGYLTIKGYNRQINAYLLDFPNNEVRRGLLSLLANDYLRIPTTRVSSWIMDSILKLNDGQTEEFRQSLTAFMASIPYDSHDSTKGAERSEKHFQYTFYLLLRLLGVYCTRIEQTQAQGRVDCTLETPHYVYIFEFKLDGTAAEALAQIEAKGYATPYATDPRTVVKIGVVFSSETRTIADWQQA